MNKRNQGGHEAARFILAKSEELTANSRARIEPRKREQEFAFLFHVEQERSVASFQRLKLTADHLQVVQSRRALLLEG